MIDSCRRSSRVQPVKWTWGYVVRNILKRESKEALTLYVVKKSNGKKNVFVFSSTEPLLSTTNDDKKKPALIKLYDFTEGGTDIIGQKGWDTTTARQRAKSGQFSYTLFRRSASTCTRVDFGNDDLEYDHFNFRPFYFRPLIRPVSW